MTTPTTTDPIAALASAVRDLATEQPEHVYQQPIRDGRHTGCVYVHDGKGSCIVGQAALRTGLITPWFEHAHPDTNAADVYSLLETLRLDIGGEDAAWLDRVQGAQDTGTPWGDAVRMADGEYDDDDE